MIIGLSTAAFTQFHVLLSLIGIVTGLVVLVVLVVLVGLWSSKALPGWTATYLLATAATSATGFLFHSTSFGPPHFVGVISLIVLAIAISARYQFRLAGRARWITCLVRRLRST